MSFMKYLQNKTQPRTQIVMDAYKERLNADLASLLIKPDEKLVEARKNIVNTREVARILALLNYPLIDEFKMAVSTADPKRVTHAHMTFRRWAEYSKADRDLSDQIETALFRYETKLYGKEFGPEDADEVARTAEAESLAILEHMANRIDLAVAKVPYWKDHKLTLEALTPDHGWVVTEGKVTVGDAFPASFVMTKTGVKDVVEHDLPVSLRVNLQDLIGKLQNNPKYNRILTLFMNRPLSERRYFELAKRDLSLGIEAVLPNHVELTPVPLQDGMDVWKVRVEEKYLRENEGGYCIVGDEAPLRWIELYKKKDE